MRKHIYTVLALWTFAGLVAFPHDVAAGDEAGDVVSRLQEAYRSGSVEQMLAVYAPNAVFEDINQRHRLEGKDALRALLDQIVAMHHRLDLREKRRIVRDDVVVVEYEYAGSLNGAVLGQAVGKEGCPDVEYALPTMSWYDVKDGRIVHQKDYIDLATLQSIRETLLAGGTAGSEGH